MTTLTIQIPDTHAERLTRMAAELNESIEQLATDAVLRIGLPEYSNADQKTVDAAIDYVMTKNHELYKRLA